MTQLCDVKVYQPLGHNKFTKFTKMKNLSSMIFSQPSIYIDGWLWHEDDVCRL